ncbi:MAG: hypothetical protein ACJA1R_000183 [Flavobacteriales bacterium]|jgi:hypothetical protein
MMMLATLGATIALGACGDDGETNAETPDTVGDAGTDGTVDDAGTDAPDDVEPDTTECADNAPVCASNRDCGAGTICEEGCCVVDEVVAPCTRHLEECSDAGATTSQFFCDTDDGRCLSRCDFENRGETESGDCPLSSFCGSELTNVPEDELAGICLPGDCDTNIFDPEACEGIGTCQPFGNDASFCIDAGTADEGADCNFDDSNSPPASDLCAPGLVCFLNVCEVPCNRANGDEDCTDAGDECLGIFTETRRNRPGVCGASCDPFGECETGRCSPLFGNGAINVWTCIQDADGTELLVEGDDCSADDVECGEGLLCVNEGDEDQDDLRCSIICDVLGTEDGVNAGCGGGDATPGPVVIAPTSFGEASAYLALPADDYDVVIRDGEGAVIAETFVPITVDQAYSVVYFWGVDGLERFIASPDFTVGDTVPNTGVRAIHASPDAGVVDIAVVAGEVIIPFAAGVDFQDATSADESAYSQVEAGSYVVRLTLEGGTVVDSSEIAVEEGNVYTIIAGGSVADDTFDFFVFADDLPALAEGTGAARLLHMADVAPTVVVHLPDVPGESDQVCSPTTIAGLGFCNEGCNPYPRTGAVGGYGCEDDTNTCQPFVQTEDRAVLPQGTCGDDEGTALGLEDCNNSGFLGGDCADFAVCLGDDEDSTAGSCLPLCEPVSQGQCAEFGGTTCSGVLPLVGQLNFSFCTDSFTPGESGGRCDVEDEGISCAADSTICLDISGGPICHPICREGIEGDCPDGLTCRTGQLNPDVVPTFMGLCQ